MKSYHLVLLFLSQFIFINIFTTVSAQSNSCTQSATFANNRLYSACNALPKLGASLHWNYHPSNGTADIAYRAPQSASGWVSWALNPSSSGMVGAQALIAFPSGSSLTVYTTSLKSYSLVVTNESLSFPVYSRAADYANGMFTIYATIGLPKNSTKVNQVWQAGTVFANGVPAAHATSGDNIQSAGSINLLSGQSTAAASGNSRQHRKNTHGVLNAVSWGILLPMGAIIARYLRVFKSADPAWFYLHAACQTSAYIVGVAGWGTGLKLGSESSGITYHSHRTIGIILFSLGTLQVFALLLRPNKDNKYRIYWNVYHHLVGYTVIVLSIVNIFKGFDILHPENKWKHAYIAIIATLGGIALVLEAITWVIVLRRKSRSAEKSHHGGANGTNGYGVRQNQGV